MIATVMIPDEQTKQKALAFGWNSDVMANFSNAPNMAILASCVYNRHVTIEEMQASIGASDEACMKVLSEWESF